MANIKAEEDILQYLAEHEPQPQRKLAEQLGYSLGTVNQGIKNLQGAMLLDSEGAPTKQALDRLEKQRPQRAVILAAGTGMRMAPINREITKGMLEVKGEPLAERLIAQLKEVGIREIYLVAGFMKEQYEYLIDKYGVELIFNGEYGQKNNLCSLAKAAAHLENAYVVPCDIWCKDNPFHRYEPYAWYLVGEEEDYHSDVALNRKGELVKVKPEEAGNRMIGIAYLNQEAAGKVSSRLKQMDTDRRYDRSFWEETLYEGQKMFLLGKAERKNEIFEINTYEQLRLLGSNPSQMDSDIIRLIADCLCADVSDICDIIIWKKGMTNRSFRFSCKGKQYIMRIPGEGTDKMINRKQECQVYEAIRNEHICDEIYYLNPESGYKITGFLDEVHTCDKQNREEVGRAMAFLKAFHQKGLKVEHTFDMFGQIEFYESLWGNEPSVYRDYQETKEHVLSLKAYIDSQPKDWALTHMDAVPDNFLMAEDKVCLIDWEYAGMQDPHVDIAAFVCYSYYTREQVDWLIDTYFPEGCPMAVRLKIYCYISVIGLLWSNWCEYKRQLGVEFGEYNLRQYRYAKEYYRLFQRLYQEKEKNEYE